MNQGRAAAVAALLAACSGQTDSSEDGAAARAEQASPAAERSTWTTTGGDAFEAHYSPLDLINRDNVAELGFAWEAPTFTTRGLEATPVIVDGVLYASGTWGKVYAVDAATGAELWRFDPGVDGQVARDACCDVVNRGVAVARGKVIVGALDGRLIALDAKTGETVWDVDTIYDHARRYTSTGAPRVAGDVVVIGNAGAEFDARGYFSAYDIDTGEFRWRFFTVPGDPDTPFEHPELEAAAETWDRDSLWEVGGGGTVWDGMAYDAELDLLYVGTGNSAPYAIVDRSPSGGDNLYVSSILAIDSDTGRLAWSYQTTPGDSWDFTATQNIVLADIIYEGRMRKVLMQAPKNGFFYLLDRETGELLSAEAYAPVNWASHVDMETGRPVMTEAADYYNEPKMQWPTDAGAHGWRPMAYSKRTGLVYIPVFEMAWLRVNLFPDGYEFTPGRFNMGVLNFPPEDAVIDFFAPIMPYDAEYLKEIVRATDAPPERGVLRAWDPVAGRAAWEVETLAPEDGGGLLATAGGLVFQGRSTGALMVYADDTGELLHSIDVGTSIMAAPATYEIDGEQYVAVLAGLGGAANWSFAPHTAAYMRGNAGRILAFKLGGGATPIPPEIETPPRPQPPASAAPAETVRAGNELFLWHCMICHANAAPGLTPDLTRMTAETHAIFDDIVLGGLYAPNGMPRFDDVLDADDVAAIHAYLIDEAQRAYAIEAE